MNPALGIAGRNLLSYRSGYGATVMAGRAEFSIAAGASIDWTTIAPTSQQLILPDTGVVAAGVQFYRYGQVFCRITNAGANSLAISGSPTGGTFTLTVVDSATGTSTTTTTAPIPYNAAASQVAQALGALANVGYGNVLVTGGNGSPFLITFPGILGAVTLTASGSGLTGGTSPAAAVSSGPGNNSQFFGPFDPSASDGRQNVVRGNCWIANRSKVGGGSLQLPLQDDYHTGECITGGRVWRDKLIATNGTASLANGPTFAALLAAMPTLILRNT